MLGKLRAGGEGDDPFGEKVEGGGVAHFPRAKLRLFMVSASRGGMLGPRVPVCPPGPLPAPASMSSPFLEAAPSRPHTIRGSWLI